MKIKKLTLALLLFTDFSSHRRRQSLTRSYLLVANHW